MLALLLKSLLEREVVGRAAGNRRLFNLNALHLHHHRHERIVRNKRIGEDDEWTPLWLSKKSTTCDEKGCSIYLTPQKSPLIEIVSHQLLRGSIVSIERHGVRTCTIYTF